MYFITLFSKLQQVDEFIWDFGDAVFAGNFSSLDAAREQLLTNCQEHFGDIYDYAIIQDVEENTMAPAVTYQELYSRTYSTTITNDCYHVEPAYERIELPPPLDDYIQIFF